MPLPNAAVLRQELTRVRREAESAYRDWARYGFEEVSKAKLDLAKEEVHLKADRVASLATFDYTTFRVQLFFHSLRCAVSSLLLVDSLGWAAASFLIAIVPFAVVAPLLLLNGQALSTILIGSGLAYCVCWMVNAYFLYELDCSKFGNNPDELRSWIVDRRAELAEARTRLEAARRQHRRLRDIRDFEASYQHARREIGRIQTELADSRHQLARRDWRSLRGTGFEDFLAEVFRALGYSVETTKVTGDQGVDLIITGKGERIAVQTKGYAKNVGNGAIQEVYTGMAYYRCNRCVAITNASFTRDAKDVARKVGCLLIDGARIVDLIAGNVPELGEVSSAPPRLPR